jgi:trk system potassium uptake protein TrkA
MTFIIVGYGRVGARTTRILREEGYEVTVVDTDQAKVDRAREAGLEAVLGDGARKAVLAEAGLAEAAAIGGLSGDMNANYEACLHGGDAGIRTVMRVTDDLNDRIYAEYAEAADEVIYPERMGAAGAKTAILGGSFNAIGALTERLRLTTLTIPAEAPVVGASVASIDLGEQARIYAHGPAGEPLTIPLPGTTIDPGDRIALVVDRGAVEAVTAELLGAQASG